MHLVQALIAGVAGAENGHAELYNFASSQSASWYTDFEGTSAQTGNVALDSNGGATVYVNELCRVDVYSSSGALIRSFVDAVSANAVEYIGQSFTGTDWDDSETGVNKAVLLQSILNLWKTNAGNDANAIDWKGSIDGSSQSLATAIENRLPVFNVTAYGAVGDGATDDTSSVASALTAASGGGIVFFPPGTYLVSGLTLTANIVMMGVGAHSGGSRILSSSSSERLISATPTGDCALVGLHLAGNVSNSNNILFVGGSTDIVVRDCILDGASFTADLVFANGGTGRCRFDGCEFLVESASSSAIDTSKAAGSGEVRVSNCLFKVTASSYTSSFALLEGLGFQVVGCTFDLDTVTSGSVYAVSPRDGTTVDGVVVGCVFRCATASILTAFHFGAVAYAASAFFRESGNAFEANVTAYDYTAPGSDGQQELHLDSREGRAKVHADNSATLSVDSDQFGTIQVYRDSTAAQTIEAPVGPLGSRLRLMVQVVGAGGGAAITLSTSYFLSDGGATVADNKTRSWDFVAHQNNGSLRWVQMSTNSGDL